MAVGGKGLSCCKSYRLSLAFWSMGLQWGAWKSLKIESWDSLMLDLTPKKPVGMFVPEHPSPCQAAMSWKKEKKNYFGELNND